MIKYSVRFCVSALLLSCNIFLVSCSTDSGGVATSGSPVPVTASPGPTGNILPKDNNYGGAIDDITCKNISGWLWSSSRPDLALPVEIYIDGNSQGVVKAEQFRKDVQDAGFGTGKYAFYFALPENFRDGKPHVVSGKVAGGNFTIPIWEKIKPTFTCNPK